MSRIFVLLLLTAPLLAAEIPAGPLPEIDGIWGEGEWEGAHVVKLGAAEARLQTSGRVLCLGVRVARPYSGERIDFYVSTTSGSSACLHLLHPAAYLPTRPYTPFPPVMVRRTAFKDLGGARFSDPYSARFRSHVLQKGETSWTAEFAVGYEALNLPAGQPAAFHLRVVPPTAADLEDHPPAKWEPLVLKIDRDAKLYETPQEDARNKLALQLFRDGAASDVLDAKFDPEAALRLADRCDGDSFHDRLYRVHIFRRANRFDEASRALRALADAEPGAVTLPPVESERRQLHTLLFDFDSLREKESGPWVDRIEASWEQEKAMRKKDADLPRVVLETSQGEVTIELFAKDTPALAGSVLAWLKEGGGKDLAPTWVTGSVGFAVPAPKPPDDAQPSGRRAWRGTLAYIHEKDGGLLLLFTTSHVHLYRRASAVGRIVEGQEVVDRLGAKDVIKSARTP